MSQYTPSTPSSNLVPQPIVSYFETFYAISDDPSAHEKYSRFFTQNAKLIMISNEANGREEILKTRKGMWEKVASRSHKPTKIYSFGADSNEVMLYGTVEYVLKDGKRAEADWAARAHFQKEEGELLMDFYQVYLDSAAMAKAK